MSDDALPVDGDEVARGTIASRRLRTGVELHDGTALSIEVFVARGRRPGPLAYVGSGVHGDEAGAVAITSTLIRDLDAGELTGTVLIVPVQNPLAFWAQHRLPLALLAHSPLDQANVNVFQSYPGDAAGNMTERIAHAIFHDLMSRSDFVMDLHTPTTGGRYLPFAFVPPGDLGPVAQRSRELATAFGVRAVLASAASSYNSEKTPHVNAARRNIPAFGVELGEGGRVEPDIVASGVAGVRRVLAGLGMLARAATEDAGAPGPIDVERLVPVRATRAGFLTVRAELGAAVAAGDTVAEISDLRGDVVERIASPVAAMVLRRTTFPVVSTGEQAVQLAVPTSAARRT